MKNNEKLMYLKKTWTGYNEENNLNFIIVNF